MSFDVIVIKTNRWLRSLEDWRDEDVGEELGSAEQIRQQCDAAFPGINWSTDHDGMFRGIGEFAIEFAIPRNEERPRSLHLALRFGSNWGAEADSQFHTALHELFKSHGWQAFAVSDNSALLEADKS